MDSDLPKTLLHLLSLLTLASAAVAQDNEVNQEELETAYKAAVESLDADLTAQLEELREVRARIAEERPPLAKESNAIAAEVRDKRNKVRLALQERDALVHDLNAISNRVKLWRDEKNYITSMLEEQRKEFGSALSVAELDQLTEGSTPTATLADRLDRTAVAIARLEDSIGGKVMAGQALDSEGVAREGTFVIVGPAAWFVSQDKGLSGIVLEREDLQPEVASVGGVAGAIQKLSAGEPASLTLDPTQGVALALEKSETTLLDHIMDGGLWIYPILLLALVATIAAIIKWFQILRIRELRPDVVRGVLEALKRNDPAAAEAQIAKLNHPAKHLLQRGLEVADRPPEYIEEALYEKFVEAQPKLQRGLIFIAIASATAPLLGLLGTVTGMIHTFELINIFGTGDAKSLASGISEALVTTEFGLIVAIPALILHALLSRRVQGILSSMEIASLAFVNGISAIQPRRAA